MSLCPKQLKSWYRLRRGWCHAIEPSKGVQVLFQNQGGSLSAYVLGAMDKILCRMCEAGKQEEGWPRVLDDEEKWE